MTNEQLRMFIAVAEQGSFRRAAEVVNKTQSTVSFAVKTLENELQLQLFSRDAYRSELTPQWSAPLDPGTWCRAPMKPSLSSVSSNIIRSWCGEQRGPCPAPVFGWCPAAKTWRVTDFATKKELALAGLGWGGIPHHMIVEELAEGRLVEFHVEGIPVRDDFEIAMVRRMDRPIGPVAEHLWSLKLSQEIGQVGKVYSSG